MNKMKMKMAALAGKKMSEMTEEKEEKPIMEAGKKAMALKAMMEKLKAKKK
jgi:hypothetical protein